MLQVGGKLDATDSEGLTPAMWACYFDQLHNLQMLQNALARIDPEEDAILRDSDCCGQSVIHWAVKGVGSLECLEVSKGVCACDQDRVSLYPINTISSRQLMRIKKNIN